MLPDLLVLAYAKRLTKSNDIHEQVKAIKTFFDVPRQQEGSRKELLKILSKYNFNGLTPLEENIIDVFNKQPLVPLAPTELHYVMGGNLQSIKIACEALFVRNILTKLKDNKTI